MANLARIPVTWGGETGLPGLSVFYADAAVSTAVAALSTFFGALKVNWPNGQTWTVPGAGDIIESTTGALVGTWTMSGGSTINGTGGSVAFTAGTGCRVRWLTTGITNGRRVRGSTFLTGMVATVYNVSGQVSSGIVSNLQTAANAIVADGSFRVWSRPYTFDPAHPGVPTRAGSSNAYTAATVLAPLTSLRTRRV